MSRTPTRAVQVRLPLDTDEFLTALAAERGESKTQVVVEALACLREQLVERSMEVGYRELAGAEQGLHGAGQDLIRAALDASLPVIPD